MSSINLNNQNNKSSTKKKSKELASEVKKMSKKKKESQIDLNGGDTYKSKGERVERKPQKPKIYSVVDLVSEQKK